MTRFQLVRYVDVTGVSGTGVVAEGVMFSDGTVSLRWLSDTPTTVVYNSVADVEAIHGHNGNTKVLLLD